MAYIPDGFETFGEKRDLKRGYLINSHQFKGFCLD
jgi:hypothetical protein